MGKINENIYVAVENNRILYQHEDKSQIENVLTNYLIVDDINKVKIIPVSEYLSSTRLDECIEEFLDGCSLYTQDIFTDEDGFLHVILDGDWKHSHLRLTTIMKTVFNMEQIGESEIGKSDCDYYTSEHIYK